MEAIEEYKKYHINKYIYFISSDCVLFTSVHCLNVLDTHLCKNLSSFKLESL